MRFLIIAHRLTKIPNPDIFFSPWVLDKYTSSVPSSSLPVQPIHLDVTHLRLNMLKSKLVFLIEVWLIYNIILILDVQYGDSKFS